MARKVMKRLTVKQFRELGLLQEVNRRFLHPLGYALEVITQLDARGKPDTTKEDHFGEVWDFSDDPEGMCFADGELDQNYIDNVKAMEDERRPIRTKALGYWVQGEK